MMSEDNILKRAVEIVHSRSEEKTRQYGSFEESMSRMRDIFNGMTGLNLSTENMFQAMIALKLSREANAHKKDNLLDAVAYMGALDDYIDSSVDYTRTSDSTDKHIPKYQYIMVKTSSKEFLVKFDWSTKTWRTPTKEEVTWSQNVEDWRSVVMNDIDNLPRTWFRGPIPELLAIVVKGSDGETRIVSKDQNHNRYIDYINPNIAYVNSVLDLSKWKFYIK